MRILLLALTLACSAPLVEVAHAEDAARVAEVDRLKMELQRLAQRNKWGGVERTYLRIVELRGDLDVETLVVAADAARHRGDVLSQIPRLVEAHSLAENPEIASRINALEDGYGRVQLVTESSLPLEPVQPPFLPDAKQAIEFARAELLAHNRFDGFLPIGTYRWGDVEFEVRARQPVQVLSTSSQGEVLPDLTLKGVSFPQRATVRGKRLLLNGVGLRNKFGIAVYVAALYVPERSTEPEELIRHEAPKRFVMHFVFRETPLAAIRDFFRDGFDKVPGSESLTSEIERFVHCFQRPLVRGDRVVFDYVPGRGTRVEVAGQDGGWIEGQAFGQALLRLFMGDDPPTTRLRDGLLGR